MEVSPDYPCYASSVSNNDMLTNLLNGSFGSKIHLPDPEWYDDAGQPNADFQSLIQNGRRDLEASVHDPQDAATTEAWILRNPTMIRLTGKHPFNAEPSLDRLMHYGFIAPAPIQFVRSHGGVPRTSWNEWTVEITGMVKNPMKITMDQLVTDFPSREFPVTMTCSGNRRKELNLIKQTLGFNWGATAVSTSVWRGAPLCTVLKRCGVMRGGAYVCFDGGDDLPGGGGTMYGTSMRIEHAMDPSRDVLLAYQQNGDVLSPDHGFPLRVIVPGVVGGRMVKWLKRIVITVNESDNYYHYRDNRFLPSHVDSDLANYEGWWYKPQYVINELNVNSVITKPSHGEILPVNSSATNETFLVKGYAYAGGGRKVVHVELTMDGGETWRVCRLDHPEKPSRYGKHWCWCFWSIEVKVEEMVGAKEMAVRAWDESQNTQPEHLVWNLLGMMNNCWFRIKFTSCKRDDGGGFDLVFDHPTAPSNQSGGWMDKERKVDHPSSTSVSSSTNSDEGFTISEVEKHKHGDSCWIIIHNQVYDCTSFLKDHPGGISSILINAGTDCTEDFDAIHSCEARKLLETYLIGQLNNPDLSFIDSKIRNVALSDPRKKISCKLMKKEYISYDTRLLRFSLVSGEDKLGLPVGKHIFVRANIDGKLCIRAYTPTTDVDASGYFDLVIKVYFKNVHPEFPNGGVMSQHLENLQIGSCIEITGPVGDIEYLGRGNFLVSGERKVAKKLAMMAGGTGITPIYRIIQSALADPEDTTEMHLIYANRTENDILLREELEKWAEENETRLKVWYVVNRSVREGWKYSVGNITEEIMREHIPAAAGDVLSMACGPPPMIEFAVEPNLRKMNYDLSTSFLLF